MFGIWICILELRKCILSFWKFDQVVMIVSRPVVVKLNDRSTAGYRLRSSWLWRVSGTFHFLFVREGINLILCHKPLEILVNDSGQPHFVSGFDYAHGSMKDLDAPAFPHVLSRVDFSSILFPGEFTNIYAHLKIQSITFLSTCDSPTSL